MSVFRTLARCSRMIRSALALVCLTVPLCSSHAQAQGVVVFAAASLQTALDRLDKDWQVAGHAPLVVSYAGSSTLAQQIDKGAPADLFLSADSDWMDWLVGRTLIAPTASVPLLGNSLVLIAPADPALAASPTPIGKDDNLAAMLKGSRLAMADPRSVPAGKYGKAALQHSGFWDGVAQSVAPFDNVRMALNFVARREAALGLVYYSDAMAEPRVRLIRTFAPDSHPPIIYPAAVLSRSTHPDAKAFLAFLQSEQARKRFIEAGFTFLAGPSR